MSRIKLVSGEYKLLVINVENNLRAGRRAAGLSQQTVADIFRQKYGKSTVKQQDISDWEKGVRQPVIENALILAQIYNCKVEDLWSLE